METAALDVNQQYHTDRVLVESYAGVQLSRAQFDSYCEHFTIADFFSDGQSLYDQYSRTPTSNLGDPNLANARITLELLRQLSEANVFFETDEVREVILEAARVMGGYNLQVPVPQPYASAMELEIRRIKKADFDEAHPAA
jgi:hypothetical protein